jgi:hypothetical protein
MGSGALSIGAVKRAKKRRDVDFIKRVGCIGVPGAVSGGRIGSATEGAIRGTSDVYGVS